MSQSRESSLGDLAKPNKSLPLQSRDGYIEVSDPEAVKYILVSDWRKFSRSADYTFAKPLSDGNLLNDGEEWSRVRGILAPYFRSSDVMRQNEETREQVRKGIDFLKSDVPIKVKPSESIMPLSINIISKIYLNDVAEEVANDLAQCIHAYAKYPGFRGSWTKDFLSSPVHSTGRLFWACRFRLKFAELMKKLQAHPSQLYTDLIELYNGDQKKVAQEIAIILVAGSETTSISCSWLLHCLGTYPDLQEKLYRDVSREESGGSAGELMQWYISEALRLFPPIPNLLRRSEEQVEILGQPYEKNTLFFISIPHLHRNEEYWDEPHEFNPLRFKGFDFSNYYYLPFGAGPQKCLGRHLGMLKIDLVVREILRKFKIESVQIKDDRIRECISLQTMSGTEISLIPRLSEALS